jgi:nucleotide-binding universal stress UspA family protein
VFTTIVVGCDGSPGTTDAIAFAEQLREPEHGRLVLVSVFPYYRGFAAPLAPFAYATWLKEQAEDDLKRAAQSVSPGVPYETQTIASPSAAAGLDDVAETVHADLLVIGPSHHGSVGKLTGRTTVQRMLHGSPCTIAVAARGRRFGSESTISVAFDGSAESRFALDTAYGIATVTGARVRICTALEPIVYASGFGTPLPDLQYEREREHGVDTRLSALVADAPEDIAVETRRQWGAAAHTVLDLAGDDTGLIVAGSRGYGPLRRVLAGGVSAELLVNGEVPVLVTPRVVAAADSEPDEIAAGAASISAGS